MEPATKKVRILAPSDTKAQLKPSQVTQLSNIFGNLPVAPSSGSEDNHSEEEEGDQAASDDESDENERDEYDINSQASSDRGSDDEDDDEDAAGTIDGRSDSAQTSTKKRKKNDPDDFAKAMSKILSSGLTSTNRKNPILARSIESKKLDEAAQDEKVTEKAKKQILAEKKAVLDKNHNAKVVGETDEEQARIIERERQLRKVAQRGVVRLFNAIRASQISASAGSIRPGAGVKKREAVAAQNSKSSFLDLIKGSSKK